MAFSTFLTLCNHRLCLAPKHQWAVSLHFPFLQPRQPATCFLSVLYLFWTFPINGIIWDAASRVWLLALSIMCWRFIHMVGGSVLHSFLWPNDVNCVNDLHVSLPPPRDIRAVRTSWLL